MAQDDLPSIITHCILDQLLWLYRNDAQVRALIREPFKNLGNSVEVIVIGPHEDIGPSRAVTIYVAPFGSSSCVIRLYNYDRACRMVSFDLTDQGCIDKVLSSIVGYIKNGLPDG